MAECRFFPECQRCNEVGDSWLPCAGGSDWTRCKGYEPMPDVKALFELADEIDLCGRCTSDLEDRGSFERWSRRICEALGVSGHADA